MKLIDTAFSNPRLSKVDVTLEGGDTVVCCVDYDRNDEPTVSGEIAIRVRTPQAANVVDQLRSRMPT